ncbi:hypothetical protein HZC21_01935 [Candidatus Peregrinibacteria bacterium]|nr:hypothetical protein [Candidatus Peregrinibacteria bacterium]
MGLKELIVLSTVGCSAMAGGCTSPDREDAKNETHPVGVVSDAPDTITEEMVAAVRERCRRIGDDVFQTESGNRCGPESYYGSKLERAALEGWKAERQCLDLYGLNNDDSSRPGAGGFQ